MGDSRGGEARPAGLAVIQDLTQVVQLFNLGERQLAYANIKRVTEGVYSIDIGEHGHEDWETVYVSLEEEASRERARRPTGASSGNKRGT